MAYFGNAVYPLPLVNPGDIVTVTTSTALSEASYGKTFVLTAAGALTITLAPLLAASTTRKVTLINDSVAGVTTINASGSDRIRAQGVSVASFTLTAGDVIILQNNGSTWSIVDNSSWKVSAGQVQSGSMFTAAAGGTPDALTATFTPAITAVANQTVLVRAAAANATTTPTFNPGSGALTIVKGNNQPLAVGDISGAGHWLELALDATLGKAILQNPAAGVAVQAIGKRQTVMSGPVDANGLANEIGTGSGLAPTLNGNITPVAMTFAAGFGPNGAIDNAGIVSSTQSFPSLPASALSFLTVDRNASTGALTLGSTLAPPQYGTTYNQAAQSVLQFGGAAGSTTFLDDFGNTWIAQGGAKVQTNQFKFGTGGLGGGGTSNALNGSTDYVRTTSITNLGNGGWSMRGWFYFTTFPTTTGIMSAVNAGGWGAFAVITTNKVAVNLSSNGSAADIANGTTGAATITTNTWYFIELTYDSVAGKYFVYVNGVLDQTINSALHVCPVVNTFFGAGQSSGTTYYTTGYADKFECLPYCQHPNGTTYTVPTTAPNVATQGYASDWFNTSNYTMNQVSAASTAAGTPPTFTAKQRLYVGEATTGAAAVSSVVSYAYNGQYNSGWYAVAIATQYVKSHNLGTSLYTSATDFNSIVSDVGAQIMVSTTGAGGGGCAERRGRNTHTVDTSNNYVWSLSTSTTGPGSMTTGYYRTITQRNW
ncbi:MAG: hypothetical protein JWP44_5103 [Mucilaginibacter sp.]|nr:hypothetical protein [Mucilaginibacter sp.]